MPLYEPTSERSTFGTSPRPVSFPSTRCGVALATGLKPKESLSLAVPPSASLAVTSTGLTA